MGRRFFICCALMMALASFLNVTTARTVADNKLDSLVKSHKVIFWGDGDNPSQDSVINLVTAFYIDQYRHFLDPAAPYFLFMSKDANLAMGVGGVVRMRGWMDWDGSPNASAFAPYLIPVTPDPLHEKKFGTTPAGTSIFMRVLGRNKKLGNYQLFIQAQFSGYNSRDFKLKKSYAIINDWTIGLAPSTFSDPAAEPTMVDSNGSNVSMDQSAVLVRWAHTFYSKWKTAVSMENPEMSIDTDANTAARSQYMPNFAASLQYEWGYLQHVQLAGIVRNLPYRDMISQKNYHVVGWGMQLSTIFNPLRQVTVYGVMNYGKAFASYSGDMLMGKYDLVPDPDTPGRLYAPRAFGVMGGVQYHFNPNLFVSATYGHSRYLPSKAVSPDEYKYGDFMCANVFWNLTPRIMFAAEIDFGKRQNFSGAHHWSKRFGAIAQFSF